MSIISNPFSTLVTILLLWPLLYYLCRYVIKISDKKWKLLEFSWILTGTMGLIGLVQDNKKALIEVQLSYVTSDIQNRLSHFEFFLSESQACIKYIKSNYSLPDFEQGQIDQDKICKWSRTMTPQIIKLKNKIFMKIDMSGLDSIKFATNSSTREVQEIQEQAKEINSFIDEYHELEEEANLVLWSNFYRSFGIILLIFAFAIRLAIASNNYKNAKES